MSFIRRHLAILFILTTFVLTATLYSVVNPLFESPDEVWHYEYVRWLVEGHGLPVPEDVGDAPWHQEGSQPPLYYLMAALLTVPIPTDNAGAVLRYNPHAAIGQADSFGNRNVMVHDGAQAWPWRGVSLAAHVARLLSVLLGTLTVFFTFASGRRLFPAWPYVAVLAAALVAYSPQFLFISAAVNNDNLVTMLSAAGLLVLSDLLVRQRSTAPGDGGLPSLAHLALLGALAGLAALSKLSGLLLAVLIGSVLIVVALRAHRPERIILWGVVTGGVALLVAGWWYLRNALLFGDPLLLSAMFAILPQRPEPPTVAELLARGEGVWRSFWAVFGWFNIVVDPWVYHLFTGITLAGLLGLIFGEPLQRLYRRRAGQETLQQPADRWPRLGLLFLWVVMILLLLIRWATMRYPQGRLLYPALSAFALLIGYGWTSWLPARLHRGLVTGAMVVLLPLALYAPWRWIAPAYAAPAETIGLTPVEADFGDQIRLTGYALGAEEVHRGDRLAVTLDWRALQPVDRDYSVFVHLTDEDQILQVQRDSYPGAGNAPTSAWTPGTTVTDAHEIVIPATAPAPARLKVDVGLYDYAGGERLLVGGHDHWTLGYVTLLPDEGDSGFPNPVRINFGDKIALLGFEFDRRVMAPGDPLTVTLWWEALAEMDREYKVFVHLVQPPEAVWAQKDEDPLDGDLPTTLWTVGQQIEDPYELRLPEDAPPGVYFVEIGIYDHDNDRLKVNFSDRGVVLGQVRVEERK